jgi:hypothetical protein
MNLFVRLIMPWRFPAWFIRTLPVAVSLKRFFALDLVFNFGMIQSLPSF